MTSPAPDPLDRPATPARLDAVIAALALPPEAAAALRARAERTPSPAEWRGFLARALLLLGTGLVLSGVISFFAFNWAELGRFAKMGVIGFAIAACAIAALGNPASLLSRVLLFAASVLVGALLAVYGQTYQTGADPWSLFGVWALLIVPWAIASCFTPAWLLVVALVDVAYGLYVGQVLEPTRVSWDVVLLLGLVAVHLLFVMAWEAQRLRTVPWLADAWAPRVLVATTLLLLLGPGLARVAEPGFMRQLGSVALVTLAFVLVIAGTFYRTVRPDTFLLTAVAGSVMALFTTMVGRVVMVTLDLGLLGFLFMTMFVVGELVLAVTWLRRRAQEEVA